MAFNKNRENVVDFVYIRFEISGDPCNLIGSNWCDLFTYRNNRSDFKVFFKVTNRIAGNGRQKFWVTFYKPAQYWIDKIFAQNKKS